MNQTASSTDLAAAGQPSPGGLIGLCERGHVPDWLTRLGIRRMCAQRLREERADDAAAAWARFKHCLDGLHSSPLAIHTDAANAQHYELPPRFFELCLGKRLKYSSCLFPQRRRDAGPGRGSHARAVCRACAACRWPGHPRTGLRLGVADPVDGAAFSTKPHHRRVEFAAAARIHRGALPRRWV